MLTINISFISTFSTLKRIHLQKDLQRIFDTRYKHFDCPFTIVKVGDDSVIVMIDLSVTYSIRFLEDLNKCLKDFDGVYVSNFNYIL